MGLGKHVVGTFCIVRPEMVSKPFSFCYVTREWFCQTVSSVHGMYRRPDCERITAGGVRETDERISIDIILH
jgi:hypothetical protein